MWQKCGIINARSQAGFKWLLPLQGEQEKTGQSLRALAFQLVQGIRLQHLPWTAKSILAFHRGGTCSTEQTLSDTIFKIRHRHAAAKRLWLKNFKYQIVCICALETDLYSLCYRESRSQLQKQIQREILQQDFNVWKFDLDDWSLKHISRTIFSGQSYTYLVLILYLLVAFPPQADRKAGITVSKKARESITHPVLRLVPVPDHSLRLFRFVSPPSACPSWNNGDWNFSFPWTLSPP